MDKNQHGLAPIIIILIVVASIVGGILAWQYFGMPKEGVKAPEEKCKAIQDTGGRDKCWYDLAEEMKNENFCKNISMPEMRGPCHENIAILKKDITLCEKTETPSLTKYCPVLVLKAQGAKPEVCKSLELSFDKIDCYYILAEGVKDFELLKLYEEEDPTQRRIKVAEYVKDSTLCEDIREQDLRDQCKELAKDETTNWKIYRNEEYGFEIKYPDSWFENESYKGLRQRGEILDGVSSAKVFSDVRTDFMVAFEIDKKGSTESLSAYAARIGCLRSGDVDMEINCDEFTKSQEKIQLDGKEAIKQEFTTIAGPTIEIYVPLTEQSILVIYTFGGSEDGKNIKPSFISNFEKMLSTFRFIE